MTVYKYVRFLPHTGMYRSKVVNELKLLGVVKMPRIFIGARDADLADVYGLVLKNEEDQEKVENYINDNSKDLITFIDDELMKGYHERYKNLDINQTNEIFEL